MNASTDHSGGRLDTLQRIELTEGVSIRLRTAGPLARAVAVFIDMLIQFALLFGISMLAGFGAAIVGYNLGVGLMLIAVFVIFWFYFVWFEAGKRNATPGKRAMGLRVARTSGAPPGLGQVMIRNLLRVADFLPFAKWIPTYAFGLASCAFTRNFQRLGDLAANTVVVYVDKPRQYPPVQLTVGPAPPPMPLTREEQLSITNYLDRIAEWSAERRREMADILEPLTGATGEEGVRRLVSIGLWIRSDSEEKPKLF